MRILTAGESHGPELTAIIDGFPSGLTVDIQKINDVLASRQQGYGRGGRMKIEQDTVHITSGVRHGKTLGSPITLVIQNKNFEQWQDEMAMDDCDYISKRTVTKPRPGHADLVGGMKRRFSDLRNVLERSSARETAIRVAIGALCAQLLEALGIQHYSRVLSIGSATDDTSVSAFLSHPVVDREVRSTTTKSQAAMKAVIDQAKEERTTVGGMVQTIVTGLPAGLGDYTQWDKKFDAMMSMSVMSINAFKAVSFGDGEGLASSFGRDVMDGITYTDTFHRTSNHMGGVEGGMTNGEAVVVNGVMKPIPTQYHPLKTVDIHTKEETTASVERSDTCAVPAASIVMEYVVLTTITSIILNTFESSQFDRLVEQWEQYRTEMEQF